MADNTKHLQVDSEFGNVHDHADLVESTLDSKSMRILYVIAESPKSASQISRETEIPINTVYNKVRKLTKRNIIKISGNINELGRRHTQYKSKLNLGNIFFK